MSEQEIATEVLVAFLERTSLAKDTAEVNIAAGIALQELNGEWTGCLSGCACEPCVEFDRLAAA